MRIINCPFFTAFLTIETSSQNISITLLQISLNFTKHRGGYCREKLPPNDFGRTVPSAKKYCCRQNREWRHFVAMSTPISLQPCITNFHLHLIQLWWQLFQIFVLNDGDLVLCSNLGGTDHEKLYLATISPSKRVFEKYKPRDLFSEFYGILLS